MDQFSSVDVAHFITVANKYLFFKQFSSNHILLASTTILKVIKNCQKEINSRKTSILHHSVYRKHLAENESEAREILEKRFEKEADLSEASILVASKGIFEKAALLAVEAHSTAMYDRMHRQYHEKDGREYLDYFFSPDDPIYAEIEAKKIQFLHMVGKGGKPKPKAWTGMQINLSRDKKHPNDGPVTVFHCSPI